MIIVFVNWYDKIEGKNKFSIEKWKRERMNKIRVNIFNKNPFFIRYLCTILSITVCRYQITSVKMMCTIFSTCRKCIWSVKIYLSFKKVKLMRTKYVNGLEIPIRELWKWVGSRLSFEIFWSSIEISRKTKKEQIVLFHITEYH